jgi:hypothetical protein
MQIPIRLQAWLLDHWAKIKAWSMRNVLLLFAAAIAVLVVLVVLSGKKSQDVKETGEKAWHENVLTKRQVKAKDKVIAQVLDSARTQAAANVKVKAESDSLKKVARHYEAKADSAINVIAHETLHDTAAAPSAVFNRLAAYKPRPVVLASGDTLK